MITTVIETPYRPKVNYGADPSGYWRELELNVLYARAVCLFAYRNGMAPYASHLHNTQFLDDRLPDERDGGILAGLRVGDLMQRRLFGLDRGWSSGMRLGERRGKELGQEHQEVTLGDNWLEDYRDHCMQRRGGLMFFTPDIPYLLTRERHH